MNGHKSQIRKLQCPPMPIGCQNQRAEEILSGAKRTRPDHRIHFLGIANILHAQTLAGINHFARHKGRDLDTVVRCDCIRKLMRFTHETRRSL